MRYFLVFVLMALIGACGGSDKSSPKKLPVQTYGSYSTNAKAMVQLKLLNHYNQEIGMAYGFFVDKNLVVANLSDIKGCYKLKVATWGSDQYSDVEGYLAFDPKSDLVLLRTFVRTKNPVHVYANAPLADSCYILYKDKGKPLGTSFSVQPKAVIDSINVYPLSNKVTSGFPVFNGNHQLCGIVQMRQLNGQPHAVVVPSSYLTRLKSMQTGNLYSVFELSTKSSKVYPHHSTINGFRMVTSMGNITIRLYNETPEYRDNFIRLVTDGFYDSLLVHRVIKGFLIQTGAADSRHAKRDDVVGWQGPGYTLPIVTHPNLFHKRGAIAASKLPSDRNPKNRCDGSQFYIVSGRIFSVDELNDLEKKEGKKYTADQRNVYTTLGGAPYLDGDYTVFGEVTAGMDIVDEISNVETYNIDRPLKDIRVWRIDAY
jgi:peptidyl-prolyl cis-trans isomerase A (cyclophilin A)